MEWTIHCANGKLASTSCEKIRPIGRMAAAGAERRFNLGSSDAPRFRHASDRRTIRGDGLDLERRVALMASGGRRGA
jgi:hypothetical protein